MNLEFLPEALGFGWAQSVLFLVSALILLWLGYSMTISLMRSVDMLNNSEELKPNQIVWFGTKFLLFVIILVFVGNGMTQFLAHGPKNSLRTPITTYERTGGEIKSLSPEKLSDEDRLKYMDELRSQNKDLVPDSLR